MGKWYDQGRSDALQGLPSDPPWSKGHRDHTSYCEGFTDGERELEREVYAFNHPAEWLAEFFEDEWCAECGRDGRHHSVTADPFGHPHATCDLPPVTKDGKLVVDPEGYERLTRQEATAAIHKQGYRHTAGNRYAKLPEGKGKMLWAEVVEEPNGGFGIRFL